MAQQTIGIGSTANDGTGDTLRDAFDKANDNFNEIYAGSHLAGISTVTLNASAVVNRGASRFLHAYADGSATGRNTFLGENAGNLTMGPGGGSATLSSYNTGIGHSALTSLTTGFYNTAVGAESLDAVTTGNYNTTLGFRAGSALTTGSTNVAVGMFALLSATTPIQNVAVGTSALQTCTTGYDNVAVGTSALNLLTTGYLNTAVGGDAMKKTTTGNRCTAIGFNALLENTTGAQNIAIGEGSLKVAQTTNFGISIGAGAMFAHTSGNYTTAVGTSSMLAHQTGGENTCLGATTLWSNVTGSGNVAIGYTAAKYELGSNTLHINNQDRTNAAGDVAGSIIYGNFNATPALQQLRFNASVRTMQNMIAARTTAPADGDLNNGELCMWWNESSSQVAWKAKNAAGTILTGSVTLT